MNADLFLPPAALLHSLQALVLSHEKATEEEMVPYLLEVLRPLKPVVIYGRTADLPPKIVKKEAVYYGWRDPKGPSLCRSVAPAFFAPCMIVTKGCDR